MADIGSGPSRSTPQTRSCPNGRLTTGSSNPAVSCRINVGSRSATVLASSAIALLRFIGFHPSGRPARGRNHFIALYY